MRWRSTVEPSPLAQMIWVPSELPAEGGGGGGGNQRPQPPRRAEAAGRDRLTVRPAPPVDVAPTPTPPREPEQTLALSTEPMASGLAPLVGDARIEVDGGIDASTAGPIAQAGASLFVAGSAVFGSDDPAAAYMEIAAAANAV